MGEALTTFLSGLTSVSEWFFQQLGTAWEFISSNPAIFAAIAIMFVGAVVGLWHRFTR